jgi:hypothetical protein
MIRVLHVITRLVKGGAQENTVATVLGMNRDVFDSYLATGPTVGPEGEIAGQALARLVLAYDQPQLAWNHTPFHPNFYVDISGFLERKLAAYACHRSQVRPDPHHASLENVERLARLRGSEVSVRAAEAYYCHRCVI